MGFRKFGQNTKTLKLAKVGLAKSVWPKSAIAFENRAGAVTWKVRKGSTE